MNAALIMAEYWQALAAEVMALTHQVDAGFITDKGQLYEACIEFAVEFDLQSITDNLPRLPPMAILNSILLHSPSKQEIHSDMGQDIGLPYVICRDLENLCNALYDSLPE